VGRFFFADGIKYSANDSGPGVIARATLLGSGKLSVKYRQYKCLSSNVLVLLNYLARQSV
jgi:hypothetical protein